MVKKKQKKTAKEKVDYPRLPIEKAAELTEKVAKSYGGIISYKELSRLGGAKGKTQGGTFGSITKSLKLYGLMNRYGLKEMKVTDKGKEFTEIEDEKGKKTFLFNLSRKIPILNELYERYGKNVPEKMTSVTDFLINIKNLEKREAGRLATLYIKNHNYFGKVDTNQLKEEVKETEELSHSKIEHKKIDEDLIELLKLKYLFNPPNDNTKETILNSILKKFKDSGDVGIDSLIEGIEKSKENSEGRKALINALLSSFEKKYPILRFSENKKEGTKKKDVTEGG